MTTFNDARLRKANDRPVNKSGRYVLLWLQMVRRLHSSHALDYALHLCRHLKKPLVVYEGLKLNYPWANARHHTFILQGMRDNAVAAKELGVAYWPFVETPGDKGRGLVRRLCDDACVLVTDDYPAYIVPAQNRAVAAKADVAAHLIDGNSLVPLSLLGPAVAAAAHLRPRIHRQFADAWANRAAAEPDVPRAKSKLATPFEPWDPACDIAAFVQSLPLDHSVKPVADAPGGTTAGRAALAAFVAEKLPRYGDGRNQPDAPERNKSSRLSPHLHYGHIGIQDVAEAVLDAVGWTPADLATAPRNRKEAFPSADPSASRYLDEAVTWRDVGYHWHFLRNAECGMRNAESKNRTWQKRGEVPQFNFETFDFSPGGGRTLDVVLPTWARDTLSKHEADRREHLYSVEEFEAGATHDELWNAAQKELVHTGRIHNYLRMLWAKKVLEWSASPAEAYRTLEHLNNKYALDGRDPNSYTGIHWCFGLFDRPWPPERPVTGVLRTMSSANTAKKFKLAGYFEYVRRASAGVPAPAAEADALF